MKQLKTLMQADKGFKTLNVTNREQWMTWLSNNGFSTGFLWLVIYQRGVGVQSVHFCNVQYGELCTSLIDNQPGVSEDISYFYFYSPDTRENDQFSADTVRMYERSALRQYAG